MSRSIRTTLALAAVALAVPATALATREHAAVTHGRLAPRTDPVTLPAAATVTSYDTTTGALTLGLTAGGSVSGAVSALTRFDCPRDGVPRQRGVVPPPCGTGMLVAGEQVSDAVVEVTPAGAAFRMLQLLPPAPTVSNA